MRPPPERQNGGATHPAAPSQSRHQDAQHQQGNPPAAVGEVIAVAYLSPPIGRQTLPLLVVTRCRGCGFVHTHRRAFVVRRVGSCGTAYMLRIAGDQRARWSA